MRDLINYNFNDIGLLERKTIYYGKTFLRIFRKIYLNTKKYMVESIKILKEIENFVSSKYNERYVKKVFKKGEKIFNA